MTRHHTTHFTQLETNERVSDGSLGDTLLFYGVKDTYHQMNRVEVNTSIFNKPEHIFQSFLECNWCRIVSISVAVAGIGHVIDIVRATVIQIGIVGLPVFQLHTKRKVHRMGNCMVVYSETAPRTVWWKFAVNQCQCVGNGLCMPETTLASLCNPAFWRRCQGLCIEGLRIPRKSNAAKLDMTLVPPQVKEHDLT